MKYKDEIKDQIRHMGDVLTPKPRQELVGIPGLTFADFGKDVSSSSKNSDTIMNLKKMDISDSLGSVGDVKNSDVLSNVSDGIDGLKVKNVGEGGSQAKYIDVDGNPIWPPNRGFDGTPSTETLKQGTLIDRYGYDGGTFVSPKDTPYTNRALAPGTDAKPYTVFEVIEPVNVQSGKIAPWFGEKGGGIQFEFSKSISELLDEGIIRKVVK